MKSIFTGFLAHFQDPDSKNSYLKRNSWRASFLVLWFYPKNTYLWRKSWRATSLLGFCSLSRSWLLEHLPLEEVLESSILAGPVLSFKILTLRILTSRGSPGEHPCWFYGFLLRLLTSGGSPGEQHPCWFCALFQDHGEPRT
jgi:hypothetical protein